MMMAHYGLGDQAGAAVVYKRCVDTLSEDLAVEPSARTKETFEFIRMGERPPDMPVEAVVEEEVIPIQPCPYRGLAAFREQDAPFFFGREDFVDTFADAVNRRSVVTVVIGSSGSGKSSVVYAGLLPALRKEQDWLLADLRPGDRPFNALAAALLPTLEPELSETDRLVEVRKLAEALHTGDLPLSDVVEHALEKSPASDRLLLVVDQFEELYTLCPDPDEQRRFLDELLTVVEMAEGDPRSPFTLVLAMRADFMGQALTHRPFADALQEGSLLLGPMTREELSRAIEEPARIQGVTFVSGLVSRILDDVGREPGNLPLLEFALTLMWERQTAGRLTHASYEDIGQVDGTLARYADQIYDRLTDEEKETARRIFVQLVRPGEWTEDTRRRATRTELGDKNWALVQRLADERLVVTGLDEAGQEIAEVVHEALIRRWDQLRTWIDADRTFRAWQERLRGALRQWEDSDRDEGALLRGVPLATSESWLAEREDEMGQLEREFIRDSVLLRERRREERVRRRRRTVYGLTGGLIVALTLALIAALFGRQANLERQIAIEERKIATSREWAASAIKSIENDPERSILLAIEALSVAHTVEAENALHQAILSFRLIQSLGEPGIRKDVESLDFSPDGRLLAAGDLDGNITIWDTVDGQEVFTWIGHEGKVWDIDFSPDGEWLYTTSEDWTAKAWDITLTSDSGSEKNRFDVNGEAKFTLQHEGSVAGFDYSPDGTLFATASWDGTTKIWDATTGNEIFFLHHTIEEYSEDFRAIDFSPNGKYLATGSYDGNVRVWDIETRSEILSLVGHSNWVNIVEFSPDGSLLASASDDGRALIWDVSPLMKEDLDTLQTPIIQEPEFTLTSQSGGVYELNFSPDGTRLAIGGEDGTAQIFDPTTGEELISLESPLGWIPALDFSPECVGPPEHPFNWCGPRLATSHTGGIIRIWDVSPTGSRELLNVPGSYAWFSSDGKGLGTVTDSIHIEPGVHVWRVPELTEDGEIIFPMEEGRMSTVYIDTVRSFIGDDTYLFGSSSNDGSLAVESHAGKKIKIFDSNSGEMLTSFHASSFEEEIFGMFFSSDNTKLALSSYDGEVRIWDVSTGDELHKLDVDLGQEPWPYCWGAMAYSPDDTRFLTATCEGTLKMWDTTSWEELWSIQGHIHDVTAARFSPDGALVATGSNDAKVKLWDAETGEAVHTLSGHTAIILWIWFSPDGKTLASSSLDGTARLWNVDSGQEVLTFYGQFMVGIGFSPDGTRFYTGDAGEDIVRVHVLPIDELIALAKTRVTRSLTTEECRVHLHLEECPTD
jgi:WD40 repeat protein